MKIKFYFSVLFTLSLLPLFAAVHYVTETGAGSMDGSSWANAFRGDFFLQAVINNAQAGDQIWVKCGVYMTTETIDRDVYLSMKNDLEIIGGFQGTETLLNERDLSCGPCSFLSGAIGEPGFEDNSYHVISNNAGINSSAVLDGFFIQDANDDRAASNNEGLGGGIYNDGAYPGNSCNPTIRNCVIRYNYAQFGAGIFNSGQSGGEASPGIYNCIITDNHAYIGGGGIDNFGLGGNASPTLINTIIYQNVAEQRAGAMYCWAGDGGITTPKIINCVFANNQAVDGGGIVSDQLNSSTGSSGNSDPSLTNSILWGNTATGVGPQFFILGGASFTANFSDVDLTNQTTPHVMTSGNSNLNTDPLFMDIDNILGSDNCLFSLDDGLRLSYLSQAINAGTTDGTPLLDITGIGRFSNPDMGVYEFIPLENLDVTEKFNVEVFPNPANDFISIKNPPAKVSKAYLLNSLGKTLRQVDLIAIGLKENVISIKDLADGVYFLQLESENLNLVYKFVKE